IPGAEPPADKTFDYSGSLGGTPVFIGCSDIDPHIPVERVYQTADVFRGLGAEGELRIYKGMGHTVNRDERSYLRGMLEALVAVRFARASPARVLRSPNLHSRVPGLPSTSRATVALAVAFRRIRTEGSCLRWRSASIRSRWMWLSPAMSRSSFPMSH